ncbi:hypothetical protein Taro_026015 [Colocasia esculenta]|uniref:RNase H type-1 domain-containing protein n=1 Tax=Colocasia esculenta TaxID=4460 RepID=A0A843V524_COLES|nr:hypothetical protein [Colocasia esculenta]
MGSSSLKRKPASIGNKGRGKKKVQSSLDNLVDLTRERNALLMKLINNGGPRQQSESFSQRRPNPEVVPSIVECIRELQDIPSLPYNVYLKAMNLFTEPKFRSLFSVMPDKDKLPLPQSRECNPSLAPVHSLLAPANSQQWAVLWSPHIALKWSILLWHLILNSIPVDETVKEKGVSLASKCSCCPQPQEESTLHLFFRSDTADQVWSKLSYLLHFSNKEISAVTDGVTAFLARLEIIATSGRLVRCTFMAALLELWCSPNKPRFQDRGMMAKHIINRTMLSIHAICICFKFQKVPQAWLAALHQTKHGMEELKSRTPTIARWITPPSGRLKLNVDGAFMRTSGTAGGGGILRDHEGNMCWAFARAYRDLNSSLAAKAMALNDGLSICCSKGVSEVLVETDSLNLLQLVTNQISSQWDLSCIMHDIAMKTFNLKAEIAHVSREANRVADCLASSAMSCTHFVIWSSWGDLPTTVKDPYHLDKVGDPSIRVGRRCIRYEGVKMGCFTRRVSCAIGLGNGRYDNREEKFNHRHAQLRNCVERALGVLKMRFQTLQEGNMYSFDTQKKIVFACLVVHNYIRREQGYDDFFNAPFDDNESDEGSMLEHAPTGVCLNPTIRAAGEALREEIANELWLAGNVP